MNENTIIGATQTNISNENDMKSNSENSINDTSIQNISFEFKDNNNIDTENIEQNKVIGGTDSNENIREQVKPEIELYLNALMHSTYCTNDACSFPKCTTFKRVTKHNKNCKKFMHDKCEFCRQLIALSIYHAKMCQNNANCLVPFCSIIKQKIETNKSIEIVNGFLNTLRYKIENDSATQTNIFDMASANENKRKFCDLEDDEETFITYASTSSKEEYEIRDKLNAEMQLKRSSFFEKIKEIKEKLKNRPLIYVGLKLDKNGRFKLFENFLQTILSKSEFADKKNDPNYASLIVFLLRKEAQISELESESYSYMMAEMFYNLESKLEKQKQVKCSVAVQTDDLISKEVNEDETPQKRFRTE